MGGTLECLPIKGRIVELEIFTACHSVTLDSDKFCLDRVFSELELECVPSTVKAMSIVVRLRFRRNEFGRHQFDFSLENPFGQQIPPHFGGSFGVSSRAELEYAAHTREFPLSGTIFKNFGVHVFKLAVGDRKFELPFTVTKMSESTLSDIVASN
jgi:hypothetical protein